jgi:hypothetical protein
VLELSESMDGYLAKLQNTNLPNVINDTIAAINAFNNGEGNNADIVRNLLVRLSDANLQHLHTVAANKNVPWKAQSLAKIHFNAGFANAGVLSARAKICENAFTSAISLYFAKCYLGDDGTYNHQAFTDHILEAIKFKATDAGREQERRRAAAAHAAAHAAPAPAGADVHMG